VAKSLHVCMARATAIMHGKDHMSQHLPTPLPPKEPNSGMLAKAWYTLIGVDSGEGMPKPTKPHLTTEEAAAIGKKWSQPMNEVVPGKPIIQMDPGTSNAAWSQNASRTMHSTRFTHRGLETEEVKVPEWEVGESKDEQGNTTWHVKAMLTWTMWPFHATSVNGVANPCIWLTYDPSEEGAEARAREEVRKVYEEYHAARLGPDYTIQVVTITPEGAPPGPTPFEQAWGALKVTDVQPCQQPTDTNTLPGYFDPKTLEWVDTPIPDAVKEVKP
jgi:hypothetical protein